MSGRPQWSYVQARLQARHGKRLQESDWRALESAHSLDHFIERVRASSLRRFTEAVNAQMSSHAIERTLRAAWRYYVVEIAAWVPPEWQPAVLWAAHIPDLPAVDALLKGDVQEWMRQDPILSEFAENAQGNALTPLMTGEATATPAARWYAHWKSQWPRNRKADARLLTEFANIVRAHVAQLAQAGPPGTSSRYRRDLARKVTRMFRRHGGAPVTVFCHLALIALDLERLRGGLARRRLFHPGRAKEAA